jgi:excisionase family DNA binding protein
LAGEVIAMNNPLFASTSPREVEPLALRPRDAAAALGVSERVLLDWRKNEGLPYVRLGSTVLHPVDELRAWLKARSQDSRREADA